MLKLRSLRAKMLVGILLPVIVALAATTLLAITHASSAQQDAAYGELEQQSSEQTEQVRSSISSVCSMR